MNKNEIATINNSAGYLSLAEFDIADTMREELNGLDGGFERIKIPSAGSTVFEIPGDDPNEPDAVKEFSAVILHHHPLHAYYKNKYTGGNQPPDCGSLDGTIGVGSPGGSCNNCSYNKFGSGENGSKACKNRRRIYVLREGEIFPLLLSLPTGSLKEFSRYIKRLLSKGNKSNSIVTKFSLKKAVNNSAIAYSQAQFAVDRPLTEEEFIVINRFSGEIKTYSQDIGFEMENTSDETIMVDAETGEIIEPLK